MNHNLYLDGTNINPGPVTLRGNVISNNSSGSQLRSGGTITNNLWIQNPYAHNFGLPTAGVVSVIDKNVYTEAVALGGNSYGWGVVNMGVLYVNSYFNLGTLIFSNNIMTNTASPTIGVGFSVDPGFTATLTNNIFFNGRRRSRTRPAAPSPTLDIMCKTPTVPITSARRSHFPTQIAQLAPTTTPSSGHPATHLLTSSLPPANKARIAGSLS